MYQIAIPTLSRVNILQSQTLKILQHHNISNSQITIFCIDKEYDQYKTISDYKIVVGELGLIKQKEFIQTYYPVDTNILFLDDDIQEIDLDSFNSLDELIVTGFNECRKQKSYIWSIYPVWNKYFRQTKSYLSTSLKFCIGAFTGIINRKDNPKITCSHREDVERSIKYFMRDGIVLRFNNVGYKTKFYNQGGLGLLKDRLEIIEQDVKYFSQVYSVFGTVNKKKEYLDFKLKNIPANTPIQIPIDPAELSVLYCMLKQISIPLKNKTNNRRGFPFHRACTFGITKGRFNGKTDLSRMSKKYPDIYNEICRIGNLFSFQFTSIHCNHNVICPKHRDENNTGNSLLLSFGEYKRGEKARGGEIIIDNKEYDAYCNGLIFNGSLLEHYNNEHVGNKYSLVFYTF